MRGPRLVKRTRLSKVFMKPTDGGAESKEANGGSLESLTEREDVPKGRAIAGALHRLSDVLESMRPDEEIHPADRKEPRPSSNENPESQADFNQQKVA